MTDGSARAGGSSEWPASAGGWAEGKVELSAGALSLERATSAVAHPGAGALVIFAGIVRDFNEGHAVTLLEYEAYESMALTTMRDIVQELEAELPGVRVAVHHRSGALGVGDVAVLCVASAPHRGEAFRACRAAIDRVKAQVPIWKREHGPEGPYWVGWQDARCTGDEHEPSESVADHGHGHEGSRHGQGAGHEGSRHEHGLDELAAGAPSKGPR